MSESQPQDFPTAQTSPEGAPVEPKKERKKRVYDPRAPKRTLTTYYSYMHAVRPSIVEGTDPCDSQGYVQEVCQRRWAAIHVAVFFFLIAATVKINRRY